MTETPPSSRTRTRRADRAPFRAPPSDAVHQDVADLVRAVRDLADAIAPLKVLADKAPAILEMVHVWNAGKNSGRAVWRVGDTLGLVAKWILSVGGAIALLWMAYHAKWDLIIKGALP